MRKIALFAILVLVAACGSAAPAATPSSAIPSELSVAEYPLTQPPVAESEVLSFASTVQDDPRRAHTAEREAQFPDTTCTVGSVAGLCVTYAGDQLFASEDWADPNAGHVVVTRQGQPIYQVAVGHASPITALRGLWAYDDHWAVESAVVSDQGTGSQATSVALGVVAVDGQALNGPLGYDEAFGFQTLGGKPFYFYKKQGKVDAIYDGVYVPLGYDEIPHYNCCSASSLNPRAHPNLVTFYGRRGDTWSYGEIGVFDQP
jgi:hypothetical protein